MDFCNAMCAFYKFFFNGLLHADRAHSQQQPQLVLMAVLTAAPHFDLCCLDWNL